MLRNQVTGQSDEMCNRQSGARWVLDVATRGKDNTRARGRKLNALFERCSGTV